MLGIRHAPQLEINVDSPHKDIILVKGSSYESPSVVLQGTVDVKAQDATSSRRLVLRLIGTHRLDFHMLDRSEDADEQHPTMHVVKEDSTVFECKWDDLFSSPHGHIVTQFTDVTDTPRTSSSPLTSQSNSRRQSPSTSHTSLFHLGSSSPSSYAPAHQIHQGTRTLPFQIVLLGDIPESVEGLGSGSVFYRLEATLEKPSGSFKSNVVKHKYIRILRTMSHDELSMAETMFIGSTWPGKVQYEFSVPCKAIAIGSSTPVHIMLVPLVKGLTLGTIRAQVIQQFHLRGTKNKEEVFQDSQVVVDSKMTEHEGALLMDIIRIDSEIKIPDQFKLVTPHCDLPGDIIKVRHKIKLQIALKNADGHTSELRTNLPVRFFISPHNPVKSRRVEIDKNGKVYFLNDTETLFNHKDGSPDCTNIDNSDDNLPSYEAHVYDQLFTPIGSPAMTPVGSLPTSGTSTPHPLPSITQSVEQDYFSIPDSQNLTRSASPMYTPGVSTMHLREQLQKLSFERLSQVPSYNEAIHSDTPNSPDLDFAPDYEDEEGLEPITIQASRRRYSSHTSPTQPALAHVHNQVHPHGPSPLRSVASTTNLLHAQKQANTIHQVHSHSPLAGSESTGASSSNLSKLVGMKLLRNHSHASLRKQT